MRCYSVPGLELNDFSHFLDLTLQLQWHFYDLSAKSAKINYLSTCLGCGHGGGKGSNPFLPERKMIICLDFIFKAQFRVRISAITEFNIQSVWIVFLLVVQGSNLDIILIHLIRILTFMGQSLGEHRFLTKCL